MSATANRTDTTYTFGVITPEELDRLSEATSQGSFQQWSGQVRLAKIRGHEAECVGVCDASGNLVTGCVILYLNGRFGADGSVYFGPIGISDDPALLRAITEAIRESARRHHAVSVACWPNVAYRLYSSNGQPDGEPNDALLTGFTDAGWTHGGFHTGYDVVCQWMYVKDLTGITNGKELLASFGKRAQWSVKRAQSMGVHVREIGPDEFAWNRLVKRPVPFWKDFGIKPLEMQRIPGNDKDTIIARFPYNMQMTPVLDVTDTQDGSLISISTDHSVAGGAENVRAEYVTKRGRQTYESLGWMNGHKLILVLPKSVTVNALSYRETGYDTEPTGSFSCDNEFYMRFWKKALRTLYVNMRDTYFDCPDRERAQWWGDVVLLMGESFYTYSPSAHALMKKAIYELVGWQKKNGVLYAPIPSGRSDTELPGQSLASIGRYGFWNYYLNTGDTQTIVDVYPKVKKYLGLWQLDNTGLTAFRSGGWTWGDWGDHRDIRLIYAGWHYLALDGAAKMADVLGYKDDVTMYRGIMKKLKVGYNKCWNGYAYRHPQYQKETDDRVQALAVIAGIADQTQYDEIFNLLKSQKHASPYMEKYVMEALFIMGQSNYALERVQSRFAPMVDNKEYSTLFEGWDIGEKGFGGGTVNHAWSGGALTVIAQYLCGVEPLKPGYELFKIEPDLTSFKQASITVPTIAGLVKSAFIIEPDVFSLEISVPRSAQAIVYLPTDLVFDISINGKTPSENKYKVDMHFEKEGKQAYLFNEGDYRIVGKK